MEVLPVAVEVTSLKPDAGRTDNPLPAADGAHGVARLTLALLVNDADAVYPIRTDPIFSDENWVSMGGLPGTDWVINAAAADAAGNLYVGGRFSEAGGVPANCIAKWDGRAWSALGSGLGGWVHTRDQWLAG